MKSHNFPKNRLGKELIIEANLETETKPVLDGFEISHELFKMMEYQAVMKTIKKNKHVSQMLYL